MRLGSFYLGTCTRCYRRRPLQSGHGTYCPRHRLGRWLAERIEAWAA